jgi:hypothetical protein
MDVIAILCVPSLLVGWQSALGVVVVASVVAALLNRTILADRTMLGCFAIAMCWVLSLHLLFWATLVNFDYWPTPRSEPVVVLAWAGAILLTPFWLKQPNGQTLVQPQRP